jgi:hypothetical protein
MARVTLANGRRGQPLRRGHVLPGSHGNGALLAQVVLTRAVSFADDFAGARAYAGVSATAETVLDVHRNGSPLGTITFGTGAPLPRRPAELRPSRRAIASRSSTRTRRMPRSPCARPRTHICLTGRGAGSPSKRHCTIR